MEDIEIMISILNHLVIITIAIYYTFTASFLEFNGTSWHMFLTGIGFHVLSAEAIMTFYKYNVLTRCLRRTNKERVHGILQLIGGSMALWGAFIKFRQTRNHFASVHGCLGIASAVLCAVNLLGGLVTYFKPRFVTKILRPSELRYIHNIYGILTFTVGMAAIFYSYGTRYFTNLETQHLLNILSVVTVVVHAFSLYGPTASLLRKIRIRKERARS